MGSEPFLLVVSFGCEMVPKCSSPKCLIFHLQHQQKNGVAQLSDRGHTFEEYLGFFASSLYLCLENKLLLPHDSTMVYFANTVPKQTRSSDHCLKPLKSLAKIALFPSSWEMEIPGLGKPFTSRAVAPDPLPLIKLIYLKYSLKQ